MRSALSHSLYSPWAATVMIWLLAGLLYAAEWTSFALNSVYVAETPSLVGTLVKTTLEALLIFALFWLVPNGKRYTRLLRSLAICIPMWYVSGVILVYDLYYRMFASIPALELRALTSNTGFVIGSGLALWRPIDWLYLLFPTLITIECCSNAGRLMGRLRIPLWLRLGAFVTTIAAYAIFQHRQNYRLAEVLQFEQTDNRIDRMRRFRFVDNISPEQSLYVNGLPLHLMRSLWFDIVQSRRDANRFDEVDDFLADLAATRPRPDEAFAANRGKNLILIMVESLNADVLFRSIAGEEVTPYLNSIFRDSLGVVSTTAMVSQAGAGVSSDGQMMYQTGLLPQIAKATAFMYYENAFPPALPQQVPHNSAFEVIGDDRSVWYHDVFSKKYDYQQLYDESYLNARANDSQACCLDSVIFSTAMERIAEARQPMVAHITTRSMHHPFTPGRDFHLPAIDSDNSLSPLAKRYYQACRYFDSQLQRFIADLQHAGLYSNSVIVIASDHSCVLAAVEGETEWTGMLDGDVVFAALNTGVTRHVEDAVGQIDAYPTILDIMGVPDTGGWRGLGSSFASGVATAPVTDRKGRIRHTDSRFDSLAVDRIQCAWQISDIAIRTNYFGRGQQ